MRGKKITIHIALAFDNNYVIPFLISITSIMRHARGNRIVIHAILSDVENSVKQHIESYIKEQNNEIFFYDHQDYKFDILPLPINTYFTQAIYFRLFLPLVVPSEIERIIYLDSDTLVLGSLLPLYKEDMKEFIIGAALDKEMYPRHDLGIDNNRYFNSGVLLIDLKAWKSQFITEQIISFLKEHGRNLRFPDQDALNIVLKEKSYLLDQRWNLMKIDVPDLDKNSRKSFLKNIGVIHFNDRFKPWQIDANSKLKFIYRHFAIRFFESPNGTRIMNLKFEFVLDYIVVKVFSTSGFGLEEVLKNSFILHICWMKSVAKYCSKDAFYEIIKQTYPIDVQQEHKTIYNDLLDTFEQNKIALFKLYNDILVCNGNLDIKPTWLNNWIMTCDDDAYKLAAMKRSVDNKMLSKIPESINAKMGIVGIKRTLLNIFINKMDVA